MKDSDNEIRDHCSWYQSSRFGIGTIVRIVVVERGLIAMADCHKWHVYVCVLHVRECVVWHGGSKGVGVFTWMTNLERENLVTALCSDYVTHMSWFGCALLGVWALSWAAGGIRHWNKGMIKISSESILIWIVRT